MAINWNSKILLAKIEASYGVDAAPTGAANGILCLDLDLKPMEGNTVSRKLERPFLGAQGSIATELHGVLTFKVELVGSGTPGVAPAWGVLMRGCAAAQTITAGTSVAYNPVSDDHESLTLHFYLGGTRYVMRGARGTVILRFPAQGLPYLEFTLRGLYSEPGEAARPTVTLTNFQEPDVVTSQATPVFKIANLSFVMREFSLDLGNALENRFLVGSESVRITDRTDQMAATVEAVPLTTFSPYALARSGAVVPVEIQHGTVAGRIARLEVDRAELQRTAGLQNQQNVVEWPLALVAQPLAGDDQWTLTLT